VNRFAQKVKSFSASPELLASSLDPVLCDEKTRSFRLQRVERGSSAILLFDHNLFKLFHFSALSAPILPFIARITPGRFAPRSAPGSALA
jgi:hypothetical protein